MERGADLHHEEKKKVATSHHKAKRPEESYCMEARKLCDLFSSPQRANGKGVHEPVGDLS